MTGRLNRAGKKHKRSEGTREVQPGNYLIVTEGTETEVNYFENIKRKINERFRSEIIVDKITINVEGTARSTMVLVNEAIKKRSLKNYSDVWVVFDRDDNSDFDKAISYAKKNGLKVAWSNESFELWLLLHFQDLNTACSRDDYIDKLLKHFNKLKLNNGTYNKNIFNIFDITASKVDTAIKRSEKLIDGYTSDKIVSPDKMNPGTTVQDLVKELIQYVR